MSDLHRMFGIDSLRLPEKAKLVFFLEEGGTSIRGEEEGEKWYFTKGVLGSKSKRVRDTNAT